MTLQKISHDRADETIEAKARWFQALSLEKHMDMLTQWQGVYTSLNSHKVKYLTFGGREDLTSSGAR